MGKHSRRVRHNRPGGARPGPNNRRPYLAVESEVGVAVPAGHVCPVDETSFDGGVMNWLSSVWEVVSVAMSAQAITTAGLVEVLNDAGPPEPIVVMCRCSMGRPPLLMFTSGPVIEFSPGLLDD